MAWKLCPEVSRNFLNSFEWCMCACEHMNTHTGTGKARERGALEQTQSSFILILEYHTFHFLSNSWATCEEQKAQPLGGLCGSYHRYWRYGDSETALQQEGQRDS
jgi:hypothetical protein